MIDAIAIAGFLFALFLPGFFVTTLFFRNAKWLERIALSISFSVMVALAIGLSLGYNEATKIATGGINPYNVWKWELIVTGALIAINLIVYRKNLNYHKLKELLSGSEEAEVLNEAKPKKAK